MSRENISNFGVTTLLNPMGSSDSSFTAVLSGGTNFPTVTSTEPAPFLVTVDQEVILCSARSSDTFTVAQRGYDNTTATSHAVGATVTHAPTAYMFNHIWSNLGDGFVADVPQFARLKPGASGTQGTAPSTWDDEFDNSGSAWTVNPGIAGSDYLDFNNDVSSCLYFARGPNSTNVYTVYKPFAPAGTSQWTAVCKMSHGSNFFQNLNVNATFFVSSQSTPSSSSMGNAVTITSTLSQESISFSSTPLGTTSNVYVSSTRAGQYVTGTPSTLGWALNTNRLYYCIFYNSTFPLMGMGIGDGYTWNWLYSSTGISMVPASVGFQISVNNAASTLTTNQTLVVDWLRFHGSSTPFPLMKGQI